MLMLMVDEQKKNFMNHDLEPRVSLSLPVSKLIKTLEAGACWFSVAFSPMIQQVHIVQTLNERFFGIRNENFSGRQSK